jgi:hypothetical protein
MGTDRKILRFRGRQQGAPTRAEALQSATRIATDNETLTRRNAELHRERDLLIVQNQALRGVLAILATRAGGTLAIASEEKCHAEEWDTVQVAERADGGLVIAITAPDAPQETAE